MGLSTLLVSKYKCTIIIKKKTKKEDQKGIARTGVLPMRGATLKTSKNGDKNTINQKSITRSLHPGPSCSKGG